VQAPTKYGFAINLETAKALGITMALPLLGRADEVIE
jgi:putative ABC transport system substrate-binding protein